MSKTLLYSVLCYYYYRISTIIYVQFPSDNDSQGEPTRPATRGVLRVYLPKNKERAALPGLLTQQGKDRLLSECNKRQIK